MREILFRGKHEICTDYGEWVIGHLSILEDGIYSISCYEQEMSEIKANSICLMRQKNVLKSYSVVPETIGQFTGVTDRNGKKIFEWDIVKRGGRIWVIEYDVKCAQFVMKTYTESGVFWIRAFDLIPSEWCEVIGNKFDNPELKKWWTK